MAQEVEELCCESIVFREHEQGGVRGQNPYSLGLLNRKQAYAGSLGSTQSQG